MNKNGEMNETITIDGKDYEVLTLDELQGDLGFDLYVRLANGEVKTAEYFHRSELVGIKVRGDRYDIGKHYLEAFGIQPLKLIERVPVSFTDTVKHSNMHILNYLDVPAGIPVGMKFRCVQITEEA